MLIRDPDTRMLTWFSPCPWGEVDGYGGIRDFYHGTAVGRALTNAFWSILGNDVITLNKYDSHPETAKLKPWSHPMFTASTFSILNYPTNIFDLVKDGTVSVHVADIVRLSPHAVHLSDGSKVDSDAFLAVTGWKHVPPVKFLPEGIEAELGLPHTPLGAAEPLYTEEAVKAADEEILTRFPRLKDQPVQNKNLKPILDTEGLSGSDPINPSIPLTPFTLYRFIAPPSARFLRTRDIAFANYLMSFATGIIVHAQGLWITAYLKDQLQATVMPPAKARPPGGESVKTIEELRRETVLNARYGKWRYPAGHGSQFPDFVFDAQPYIDSLVGDLGCKVHRKSGWLAEATSPYGVEDYTDLIPEWTEKSKAE